MFSTSRRSTDLHLRLPLVLAAALVPALVSGCGELATTETAPATTPVIVDYSPTVSDANALLYVAARRDVDLLAVTMPSTGEADCLPGARITHSLLAVAHREGVPVGCGAEVASDGRRDWPAEWRAEANHLRGVALPSSTDVSTESAEQLLADVIGDAGEPVTVLATGPLTNIARVIVDHPELIDRIEQVVVMGGAVAVDGNVEAAPAAEWNLYVDPLAAKQVLTSGVDVVVVPLDATNQLPWTPLLVSRLGLSEHDVARTAHQIVSGRASLEGIFLWDELAAIVALQPGIASTESMRLAIDTDGALTPDPNGTAATIALSVDAEAATSELLRTLNGGRTMTFAELDADETTYVESLAATTTKLAREFTDRTPPPSGSAVELATLLVETFWSALAELRDELQALDPPVSMADDHRAFLRAVDDTAALEGDLISSINASAEDDPWNIVDTALAELAPRAFPEMIDACGRIEAHSLAHGGPAMCELFGE